MQYINYQYIYPPRPEYEINQTYLQQYDNGDYVAQVKYNGSCAVVFLPGDGTYKIMNRHKQPLTRVKDIGLHRLETPGRWTVLVGEYLNKSQAGERGLFNHKFVIFDILVAESEYLTGSTVMQRLTILEGMYPCFGTVAGPTGLEGYRYLCNTNFSGIYRAPSYLTSFDELFKNVIVTPLYEGLVLKRREAQLQFGFTAGNNTDYMLKIRKPTKNYAF